MGKQEKTDPTEDVKSKLDAMFSENDFGDAIVIFTHKGSNEPQLWRKGHFYDVTVLMNHVLSLYKQKVSVELGLQI